VSRVYLGYRILVFLFVFSNYVANLAISGFSYYFIYLTNWGITLLLLHELAEAATVAWEFWNHRQEVAFFRSHVTLAHCVSWILSTTATGGALLITIIYWALLFPGEDPPVSYQNVFVHGLNSVIVLVDVFISARPWRFHHVYMPVTFGLTYLTFSIVYYYAGGTDAAGNAYIYPILDWSDPGPTVGYVFLCVVAVVLIHAVLFGFYRLRKFIHDDLCGKAETEELFWVNSGQRATHTGTIYTVDREKNGGRANDGYD